MYIIQCDWTQLSVYISYYDWMNNYHVSLICPSSNCCRDCCTSRALFQEDQFFVLFCSIPTYLLLFDLFKSQHHSTNFQLSQHNKIMYCSCTATHAFMFNKGCACKNAFVYIVLQVYIQHFPHPTLSPHPANGTEPPVTIINAHLIWLDMHAVILGFGGGGRGGTKETGLTVGCKYFSPQVQTKRFNA